MIRTTTIIVFYFTLQTLTFSSRNVYAKHSVQHTRHNRSITDKKGFLDLSAVIQQSLKKNSKLKAQKHRSLALKADLGPIGSYPNPQVAYEVSNLPIDSKSFNESPMTGKEIRISQKIPFPGKLTKKKRAASHKYEAAKQDFYESQGALIRDVKQTYYDLYFLNRKKEIYIENKKLIQQFVDTATTRYKVGKGLQQDVLNAQVAFSEIIKDLILLEENLQIREADLNFLLDREAHHRLPKPPRFKLTRFDYKKISMNDLLQISIKSRPKYKEFQEHVKSAEASKSFAAWNYFPDFEFGFKYRIREANPVDSGTNFISGYVQLSIPLYFFSNQNKAHTAAAERLMAAEYSQMSFMRHLNHQIHHIYLQIKETHHLIRLYESSLLPQAEQALASAQGGYQVNKVDFLTLLSSEKALFDHRVDYEKTRAGYESNIAQLEAATGTLASTWSKAIKSKKAPRGKK